MECVWSEYNGWLSWSLFKNRCFVLLADSFEEIIKTCLELYELGPCHYFSSHGLKCDAMLKITGIELEHISDIDMHLFIEIGMRRGIPYIANNKYM